MAFRECGVPWIGGGGADQAGPLGSLIAPAAFGWVTAETGSLAAGSALVAAVLVAGGCAVLTLRLPRAV